MSKQLIDYKTGTSATSDSGEVELSSIKPVANTEPASEAVFNRPTENLRYRTEVLRKEVEGLKYLADADRALLISGGGTIAWNAGTGKFATTADLKIRPFTAPPSSKEAKLTIGGLTIKADRTVVKPQRAYGRMDNADSRGANDISVEIVASGTAAGPSVEITGTPSDNVKITYSTNINNPTTVAGLVSYLNSTALFTNLGLKAEGTSTAAPTAMALTKLSGGLDAELHVITSTGLTTFFSDSASILNDGDCLAIWYENLVDGTGAGGRRQSINDGTESTTGDGTNVNSNLTNLTQHPERAANAIPVCTRDGDTLVFLDGTRIRSGIAGTLGGIGAGQTIEGNLVVSGKTTTESLLVGNSFSSSGTSAQAKIRSTSAIASDPTVVVEQAAGQTGDLTRWTTASAGTVLAVKPNGQVVSSVTTGTAPLNVVSTTKVDNLNADFLDGKDWTAPGPIGGGTASTGAFTTLNADSVTSTNTIAAGGNITSTAGNLVATTGDVLALDGDVIARGAVKAATSAGVVKASLSGNTGAITGTSIDLIAAGTLPDGYISCNGVTAVNGINANQVNTVNGTITNLTSTTVHANTVDAVTSGAVLTLGGGASAVNSLDNITVQTNKVILDTSGNVTATGIVKVNTVDVASTPTLTLGGTASTVKSLGSFVVGANKLTVDVSTGDVTTSGSVKFTNSNLNARLNKFAFAEIQTTHTTLEYNTKTIDTRLYKRVIPVQTTGAIRSVQNINFGTCVSSTDSTTNFPTSNSTSDYFYITVPSRGVYNWQLHMEANPDTATVASSYMYVSLYVMEGLDYNLRDGDWWSDASYRLVGRHAVQYFAASSTYDFVVNVNRNLQLSATAYAIVYDQPAGGPQINFSNVAFSLTKIFETD